MSAAAGGIRGGRSVPTGRRCHAQGWPSRIAESPRRESLLRDSARFGQPWSCRQRPQAHTPPISESRCPRAPSRSCFLSPAGHGQSCACARTRVTALALLTCPAPPRLAKLTWRPRLLAVLPICRRKLRKDGELAGEWSQVRILICAVSPALRRDHCRVALRSCR